MKTRIISGIVMALILATVLTAGFLWHSVIITISVAIIAAIAIYELLNNAVKVKSKTVIFGAMLFAALTVFSSALGSISLVGLLVCIVFYGIFAAVMVLKNHAEFDLAKIASVYGLPLPFAVAFFCLSGIITQSSGIYYLLLLLNFSSVCDIGAYFTGVTMGKTKLCPNISPKKTVEGAIGGIASSLIVTFILTICFNKSMVLPLIATIPLCILGMVGDLFASAIKRSVNLKDYGNLIPGHGGILDRVDSIIMIAPLMYLAIGFNVI